MAKNKNDYFSLTQSQIACTVEAAELLEYIITSFSNIDFPAERQKMHELEHKGDLIERDIINRLATEFITPIDQEDILRLVQIIDVVTDSIDESVMDFYMYCVDTPPAKAAELVKIVKKSVEALAEAIKNLRNFKKPESMGQYLEEISRLERESDLVYTEAVKELFVSENTPKALIGGKEIYESLEECCDQCEHAADVIKQIIMKNT